MLKLLPVICIFVLFRNSGWAQSGIYDISLIPENIKKNANRVTREENILLEVSDIDRAVLTVHKVVTVLNEKGKTGLVFEMISDKFCSLSDVEIRVMDIRGKVSQKLKQRDVVSLPVGDGLIDDSKINYLTVNTGTYPVTVQFDYEIKFRGILSFPKYEILVPGEGVEKSTFTVKVKSDIGLRYKEKNIRLLPDSSSGDSRYKEYRWSVQNLSPIEYEEDAVSYESRYPSIWLAPNRFKLDDYEGDMSSWKSFGLWYGQLKKDADKLPPDRIMWLKHLVEDSHDDHARITRIYQEMQKNFRYVSIQLGIGGFKPFPAEITDKRKYGDCKALSNYMQAALEAVGIKAYQALINAGYNKEPVDPQFPCNSFNHVILCVPLAKDTVWLECTSKITNAGELGKFTQNRFALLITDDGGILVPTPRSNAIENTMQSYHVVELTESGSGRLKSTLTGKGEFRHRLLDVFEDKAENQKEYFVNYWGYKTPDNFNLKKNDTAYSFSGNMELTFEKIPEMITSTKMFLPERMYNFWPEKLPKSENRHLDYFFEFPFIRTDTTEFQIPEFYKAEAVPEAKYFSCEYGSFQSHCWYNEKAHKIYTVATLTLTDYRIPSDKYPGVKAFFDKIELEKNQRIVIRKNG